MRSVLRRSTLTAGLVAALAASLSATPVQRATAQEDVARVVFAAGEVGQRQVLVVSADGSQRRQLTTGSNDKDEPTWSPDGSQVAFTAETPSGGQLFVIDVDGTHQRQLTDFPQGMVRQPAWSPDGSSIAFARIEGTQFTSLYIIGADGTGLRQLTRSDAGGDSQPQWSPDGSRLVFIRLSDGHQDVAVINVDGTGERHLTNQAFAARAEWASDGATIAYGADNGAQFVITVVGADGSAARTLPGNGAEPTWAPDSGQVAYLGFDEQPGRPLYASGPDGSGFRQVARAAGLDGRKAQNHLDWSADAAQLLYHDGQELFVVDADGGQP